jgi:hypothetical protein
MSRKRKESKQVTQAVVERVEAAIEQIEQIEETISKELDAEELLPRRFTPRACTSCTALRPSNTNYSQVYAVRGTVRYCKCRFCGNTWSQEASV